MRTGSLHGSIYGAFQAGKPDADLGAWYNSRTSVLMICLNVVLFRTAVFLFNRQKYRFSVFTKPDAFTVFIDGPDAMERDAVFLAFFIEVVKKIMVTGNERNVPESQFNRLCLGMVHKGKLEISLAKFGIPVNAIQ